MRASMVVAVALLLGAMTGGDVRAQEDRWRNAILNGYFLDGMTGWSKSGPNARATQLALDRWQHADSLSVNLIVRCPSLDRSVQLHAVPRLVLRGGEPFDIVLRISGKGSFSFGALEYSRNGRLLGENLSELRKLPEEPQDFRLTYQARDPEAAEILPTVRFSPEADGEPLELEARVAQMEILVHDGLFQHMTARWPQDDMTEQMASYKGFTEEELAQLRAVEDCDVVLPPYRPIGMQQPGDYELTTSRLRYGDALLPESITVLGKPILATPIQLVVELTNGARFQQVRSSEPRLSGNGTRVVMDQVLAADGVELNATLEVEYDAFMVCTLDFTQHPEHALTNATLRLPLRADVARHIRYDVFARSGWGGDSVFGYGPVPRTAEKVETRHALGNQFLLKGGTIKRNDWAPLVPGEDGLIWQWRKGWPDTIFLGDEARGLSLVNLGLQGCRQREPDATVRLERSDEAVVLTYRFVTERASLQQGRRLQFALQVMPPKPVKDWFVQRGNHIYQAGTNETQRILQTLESLQGAIAAEEPGRPMYVRGPQIAEGMLPRPWTPRPHRRYRDCGSAAHAVWSIGCNSPLVKYPERLTAMVQYADRLGHLLLPYLAASHIARADPSGYYYVERTGEWEPQPRTPRPRGYRPTCPASRFSAYMAHGIGRMIDQYGIAGAYFDNARPILCHNAAHGCGATNDRGERCGTPQLLGMRKLFKMVRHEFVKRGVEPFIMTHEGLHPGLVSFIDADLSGEGTYGSDHTEMITLGEWRARWLGQNQFGINLFYLPQLGYGMGPDANRREQQVLGTPRLLLMSLLHGTHVRAAYLDHALVYRVWDVLDEMDEPGVTLVPYWDWEELNGRLNADQVYASAYNGSQRMLLVLGNLSGEDREVSFPLSALQKKNSAVEEIVDHMHAQPVTLEAGMVRCLVPAKNFRLLSCAARSESKGSDQ